MEGAVEGLKVFNDKVQRSKQEMRRIKASLFTQKLEVVVDSS